MTKCVNFFLGRDSGYNEFLEVISGIYFSIFSS